MSIHWESLIDVVVVSFGSTIAVVVLIALAVSGWSARTATTVPRATGPGPRHLALSRRGGTAVAVACLSAAAVVVLLALWEIVG